MMLTRLRDWYRRRRLAQMRREIRTESVGYMPSFDVPFAPQRQVFMPVMTSIADDRATPTFYVNPAPDASAPHEECLVERRRCASYVPLVVRWGRHDGE